MSQNKNQKTEQNDNFANEVLPSFEIEDNPVIYSVKRNDKYYIVSFGKVLIPQIFDTLEDVKEYVTIHQTRLIQLSMLAYWYACQHNELDINKLKNA